MNLPNIEYALDQGYDLLVTKLHTGKFHARITLGTTLSEHGALGKSLPEALEEVEKLLTKSRPIP